MKPNVLVAEMLAHVATFNLQVTGIMCPASPRALAPQRLKWALTALREEVQELEDSKTVPEAADALVDLIYFALGRLHEMGVPADAVFDAVHQANMQKERGEVSRRPGSMGHDAIKPEGWKPPDHTWLTREGVLEAIKGWEGLSPALKKIAVLRAKKGEDYNAGIGLFEYFPFGHESFAQMVFLKGLRLVSLVKLQRMGKKPNFEGIIDTLEDCINYATFYLEWLSDEWVREDK